MSRRHVIILAAAITATALPVARAQSAETAPLTEVQDRSTEVIVLNGNQFPGWSAGPDLTLREPQVPTNYDTFDPPFSQSGCYESDGDFANNDHNCYQDSRIPRNPNSGVPVEQLLGYTYDDGWKQIPFQVDERAVRYLTNNASGFAFYSGVDQNTTYVWDVDRFRFTANDEDDPCKAVSRDDIDRSPDPIAGLDDNDEIAFMFRDAGAKAPAGEGLPEGIEEAREIVIADPSNPDAAPRFAYVMLAAEDGPAPAFDATNSPYIRYQRDPNADELVYSQSSYSNYGNTYRGVYCDGNGNVVMNGGQPDVKQRRPLDTAWIYAQRYAFRYDGRWLMTQMRPREDAEVTSNTTASDYGPDLIDRWKARAFQQRPGGETPCCGYEEEENNWGGSSILMGERAGPVRVIRAAWGADSSTNNIRQETFTAYEMRFRDYLRVHVIPPADGIYVQWDYNAGMVDRYYNPQLPEGIPVDGQNDEVFGNLYINVGDGGIEVRDDAGSFDPIVVGDPNCRILGESTLCNDIDQPDPFTTGVVSALNWEQVSGPNGGWVTRWGIGEHSVGGDIQGILASPYYRDDSCFDDGTGDNPGRHVNKRSVDPVKPCWTPENGIPSEGNTHYQQGSIGTHGLHLQIIADSDNAQLTVPVTEIVSEQRNVVLTPSMGNTNYGETYGRGTERPLVVNAIPYA